MPSLGAHISSDKSGTLTLGWNQFLKIKKPKPVSKCTLCDYFVSVQANKQTKQNPAKQTPHFRVQKLALFNFLCKQSFTGSPKCIPYIFSGQL